MKSVQKSYWCVCEQTILPNWCEIWLCFFGATFPRKFIFQLTFLFIYLFIFIFVLFHASNFQIYYNKLAFDKIDIFLYILFSWIINTQQMILIFKFELCLFNIFYLCLALIVLVVFNPWRQVLSSKTKVRGKERWKNHVD